MIEPCEGRSVEQPQLEHTLGRSVRFDIFAVVIYQVLFGLEYVALTSKIEFDFRMIFIWDRRTMGDTDFRRQRLDLAWWIPT